MDNDDRSSAFDLLRDIIYAYWAIHSKAPFFLWVETVNIYESELF
jgi:hypothetical protein